MESGESNAELFLRGKSLPRVIGDVTGPEPGPTVIITGGLHGNEPAGVLAALELMQGLDEKREVLRGRVVAFSGNRPALARGVRFLERDLNRRWHPLELDALSLADRATLASEDAEQRDLLDAFLALETHNGQLAFLDLHTTSGTSEPFVCFADTLANRRVGLGLPVPAILGLEETIDGSMLGWCADRGHLAVAFEAGKHDDPRAHARHLAALWIMLVELGCLDASDVPDLEPHRALLATSACRGPRVVEVRHRHVVSPEDEFSMLSGFSSFDRVGEGEVVAVDRRGPIRVPYAGLILMPRYQGQGEDGYFIVRELAPFWLRASGVLQRLPAGRMLSLLPGVARESDSDRLVVDPDAQRSFTTPLMHLCGYRRRVGVPDEVVFTRRIS
ncbi:hypothetical protein AKJ09_08357 [Labilithrix luteola]|uniref:Succinylglutamate desuccinylase/Aspartoacylase catalytic domain-containing protein n=1 Tax=Labilithrix luteola TaxID=1391654 RepID=A0A0K1Q7I7_9BACT|nr:succinylglutamate desuccinylase/aspartoacylase family protein [Labilithrix luteola]AKV01694.1 hypothetical protein AKJ09_08357 [Labilithrix luteola]